MKEEHEQWKEAHKKVEKKEIQHHNRVNKSFEKIPRFNGTNLAYCFDWLTQVEALVNDNAGRNYREELLFNCGISVTKMIQAVPQGASHQEIKDAVLRNHSDLRTPSQRSNAYQNLYQKPDEALQTYNTRYSAYFGPAYPCTIPVSVIVLCLSTIFVRNINSSELHFQSVALRSQYSDHMLEAVTLH